MFLSFVIFLGIKEYNCNIFLDIEEYNCNIFLGTKTNVYTVNGQT
jgi:hypothetical protein